MFFRFRFFLLLSVCVTFFLTSCSKDDDEGYTTIDFQDEVLGAQKYNNYAGATGVFVKGIVSFANLNPPGYWCGFALSQMHDTETLGSDNQYSVYDPKDSEENIFMVGYIDNYEINHAEIRFSQPVYSISFDLANTTYAALSMKNGDAFAKKFEASDWLKLTITPYNSENKKLPAYVITLADGTEIGDMWTNFSLFAEDVVRLEFTMESTDVRDGWLNTPTYFCLDNLKFKTH